MAWFRKASAPAPDLAVRVTALETQVEHLAKLVRAAQAEVVEVSERAFKLMKRAQERSRRELDAAEANQGQAGAMGSGAATPPPPPPALWGGRARIAARRARAAGHEQVFDLGESNGVHP